VWAKPPLQFQAGYLQAAQEKLRSSAHALTGAPAVNDWVRCVGAGRGVLGRRTPARWRRRRRRRRRRQEQRRQRRRRCRLPPRAPRCSQTRSPPPFLLSHPTPPHKNQPRPQPTPPPSHETRGLIKDLVDPGMVARAVAILVSAVYFKVRVCVWGGGSERARGGCRGRGLSQARRGMVVRRTPLTCLPQPPPACAVAPEPNPNAPPPDPARQGTWQFAFDEPATAPAPFTLSPGGAPVSVPMMYKKFGMVRRGARAFEFETLCFKHGDFGVWTLVPDPHGAWVRPAPTPTLLDPAADPTTDPTHHAPTPTPQQGQAGYTRAEGQYEAVRLPYKGGQFAAVALLPDAGAPGGCSALVARLAAEPGMLGSARWARQELMLWLPRFKLECSMSLKRWGGWGGWGLGVGGVAGGPGAPSALHDAPARVPLFCYPAVAPSPRLRTPPGPPALRPPHPAPPPPPEARCRASA
jgi:hypothetical protein